MASESKHRDYFQRIAPQYRSVRTTDKEPISYIVRQLKALHTIKAADIGCGTGRYTQLLFHYLADKISFMCCIDYSSHMLGELNRHFAKDGIRVANKIMASAMCLPLKDKSLNCIFTFNAIHHFALVEFLREAARILGNGGYLIVYTRLRSQNKRNVWGKFFPLFTLKETRLYEWDELQYAIDRISGLRLQKTRTFKFNRKSTLKTLIYQANSHHYSTFDLYNPKEFDMALEQFRANLRTCFDDQTKIHWVDENILLILQKVN